jgi:NTE family protein
VVFRSGSLSSAMRASMSVPGLMSPVEIDGQKLVDGGLVNNVPIDEARSRCQADIAIAVNVGSPLLKADQIGSLLSVSGPDGQYPDGAERRPLAGHPQTNRHLHQARP